MGEFKKILNMERTPYTPRTSLIPLVPLDLMKIKQEIEETRKLEIESIDENTEEIDESEGDITIENLKETLNTSFCMYRDESDTLNDKKKEKLISKSLFEHRPTSENNDEKENESFEDAHSKKNYDSFDLNFSALSIQTPQKQTSVTVSVSNNNPKSSCNKYLSVNNNHNVPFETPVSSNNQIRKNQEKHSNIICSIPRVSLDDKTFEELIINNKKYFILNMLGRGGSSIVYQCFWVERKILVAIKCVSLNNESAEGYINEINLLKKLRDCDRVITLYDSQILIPENKLFIVLEKGGDDLHSVLKKLSQQEENIPFYMLTFYWMEVLQAVKQIHSHGIIHADLKPSNFLWGDKGLKLIDFGISSSVQSETTSVIKNVAEGSLSYVSPEALTEGDCNHKYKVHFKSDVWSLGCILYQFVYKKTPFQHIKLACAKYAYITNPNHTIEYPEITGIPPKIIDIIKQCLQYTVQHRPSVDELIKGCESLWNF